MMKYLWHQITWFWHAMFCSMPGWEITDTLFDIEDVWIKCKGCLHQTIMSIKHAKRL